MSPQGIKTCECPSRKEKAAKGETWGHAERDDQIEALLAAIVDLNAKIEKAIMKALKEKFKCKAPCKLAYEITRRDNLKEKFSKGEKHRWKCEIGSKWVVAKICAKPKQEDKSSAASKLSKGERAIVTLLLERLEVKKP